MSDENVQQLEAGAKFKRKGQHRGDFLCLDADLFTAAVTAAATAVTEQEATRLFVV